MNECKWLVDASALVFLYFLFLTHLGITCCHPYGVCICLHLSARYRHPQVQPYLSSFTCILLHCTWSPGCEWSLLPRVIACFSGLSSYLYMSDGFTFPDPHTRLFPLNLVKGWPKSWIVSPWPTARRRLGTSLFKFLYLSSFLTSSCMHHTYVSYVTFKCSCLHDVHVHNI